MSASDSRQPSASLSDEEYGALIDAYLAGDGAAADDLSSHLARGARVAVQGFARGGPIDADDLVQDTVVAVLDYLKRNGGFRGSLLNFTISVARNRCRNWLIWKSRHPSADAEATLAYLRDPSRSPLEVLAEQEIFALLQQALDRLDTACRRLLRAFYLEGVPMGELLRRSGVSTLQAVYYRRARCLEKLGRFLKIRLRDCSSTGPVGDD